MQIEDSDNEEEDKGMDRDAIANELFDADDVSNFIPFFFVIGTNLINCFSTIANKK